MSAEKRIPTNLRTLIILETIGRLDRPVTATQINEMIGLPKQTIHRLCSTLEAEGFLLREPNGKRLMASARLKSMASGILYSAYGSIAVRQILHDLASSIGETVNLVIPEDDGMTYIERVETGWPLRIQLPVGSHVPFHCTASGKVFLASLPSGKRRSLLRSMNLEPRTSKSHQDREVLLSELSMIAKRGYSVDDQEFMDGMIAVAVPVTDLEGRYCASLAVHGPSQRLSVSAAIEHFPTLQSGAERLSQAFFE